MALSASTVWEVRTDGDDDNGGGFVTGASGTDYSQQAAAQATLTANSVVHTTTTQINVHADDHTVHANDVGNLLQITGGDATAGWYEITAVDTGNNRWTVDRAVGTAADTVVGKMGGALASPGAAMQNQSGTQQVWIKAGTYTLTTATPGPGGPLAQIGTAGIVQGYDVTRGDETPTKPIIEWGGLSAPESLVAICTTGTRSIVANLVIDCEDVANVRPFRMDDAGGAMAYRCEARNSTGEGFYAFASGIGASNMAVKCKATGCNVGFSNLLRGVRSCAAVRCATGFSGPSFCEACLAIDGTTGFSGGYGMFQCIAFQNSSNGFYAASNVVYNNCISVGNGSYGFGWPWSREWHQVRCVDYANTSGRNQVSPVKDIAAITLTANPFLCPISGTGFSYTAATKTLTKAGAFSDIASGDATGYRIRITGGTNMTPGEYWIDSKTSDDAVVLATDAGTDDSADAVVDYDFNINNIAGGGATLRAATVTL